MIDSLTSLTTAQLLHFLHSSSTESPKSLSCGSSMPRLAPSSSPRTSEQQARAAQCSSQRTEHSWHGLKVTLLLSTSQPLARSAIPSRWDGTAWQSCPTLATTSPLPVTTRQASTNGTHPTLNTNLPTALHHPAQLFGSPPLLPSLLMDQEVLRESSLPLDGSLKMH